MTSQISSNEAKLLAAFDIAAEPTQQKKEDIFCLQDVDQQDDETNPISQKSSQNRNKNYYQGVGVEDQDSISATTQQLNLQQQQQKGNSRSYNYNQPSSSDTNESKFSSQKSEQPLMQSQQLEKNDFDEFRINPDFLGPEIIENSNNQKQSQQLQQQQQQQYKYKQQIQEDEELQQQQKIGKQYQQLDQKSGKIVDDTNILNNGGYKIVSGSSNNEAPNALSGYYNYSKNKKNLQNNKSGSGIQKGQQNQVKQLKKTDFTYSQQSKVRNLMDGEEEIGEVGEWIEKTANIKQDDEFDNQNNINNNDDDDDFINNNNSDHHRTQSNYINNANGKDNVNNDILNSKDQQQLQQQQQQQSTDKTMQLITQSLQNTENTNQSQRDTQQEQLEKINKKVQGTNKTSLSTRQGYMVNQLSQKAKFMTLGNNNSISSTGNMQISQNGVNDNFDLIGQESITQQNKDQINTSSSANSFSSQQQMMQLTEEQQPQKQQQLQQQSQPSDQLEEQKIELNSNNINDQQQPNLDILMKSTNPPINNQNYPQQIIVNGNGQNLTPSKLLVDEEDEDEGGDEAVNKKKNNNNQNQNNNLQEQNEEEEEDDKNVVMLSPQDIQKSKSNSQKRHSSTSPKKKNNDLNKSNDSVEDEWDMINKQTLQQQNLPGALSAQREVKQISFQDAWAIIKQKDLTNELQLIFQAGGGVTVATGSQKSSNKDNNGKAGQGNGSNNTDNNNSQADQNNNNGNNKNRNTIPINNNNNSDNSSKPSFFKRLFSMCSTTKMSRPGLLTERDQILAFSRVPFNDREEFHFQILYTIFCQLKDTDHCLRYGHHWEEIGFQGTDPATDLRGVGMLGLLQMLAFVLQYKDYLKECLRYSEDETYNFPMCVTLINITGFTLEWLQQNRLNEQINAEKQVMSILNKTYFAAFFHFFEQYKQNKSTIHQIGQLLANIRDTVGKNSAKYIANFNKKIAVYYKKKEGIVDNNQNDN